MNKLKGLEPMDMDIARQYLKEEALFEKRLAELSGIAVEQLHEQRETIPHLAQYFDVMLQGWLLAKEVNLINEKSKGLLV